MRDSPDAQLDPLIAATLRALELAVRTSGDPLTADGRVSELVAAALLNRSAATLRNWRSCGDGPAFVKFGVDGAGRVSYRLADLAEYLHILRATPSVTKPH